MPVIKYEQDLGTGSFITKTYVQTQIDAQRVHKKGSVSTQARRKNTGMPRNAPFPHNGPELPPIILLVMPFVEQPHVEGCG